MAEPRNDDRSQARSEAAALLGIDIDDLSPVDGLRVDMVSALRLVIDAEQASVLSGGSADLGKLNVAVQSLIALLPGRELPAPESEREDPRVVLWRIIKEGRDRLAEGFEGYDGKVKQIEVLQAELAALKVKFGVDAEYDEKVPMLNAALKAGSASAPLNVPTSDIVPPGEYLGVPAMRGPDDPAPKSTAIIEAKAVPNPPAAPAWQDWIDRGGGGAHYDRWADNRD